MKSKTILITVILLLIITLIVIIVLSKRKRSKRLKNLIEQLDREKNIIETAPIPSELSKLETIIKNDKIEEKYNNWMERFDLIRTENIDITGGMKYNQYIKKIAQVEIELAKAKELTDTLLDEIKEITLSEEKYRSIITKLKTRYRELSNSFDTHKKEYGDIAEIIELQFENIEKRFQDFESAMEKNEYNEVVHIVKAIDSMIDHMGIVITEVPDLVLLTTKLIPKRIEQINTTYDEMTGRDYPLEYLQIPYNIEQTNKNVSNIIDRIKVLNLEDCMFELKTMLEYLDSLFVDFENEKLARKKFEEDAPLFERKLEKINKMVSDIYNQLDEIKSLYDLKDEDVTIIDEVNTSLIDINKDYKKEIKNLKKRTIPYTQVVKDIEVFSNRLKSVDEELDVAPIVTNDYFVQLSEANDAILEIIKELERKPIVIKTLNTRVDTARDLVLKLYNTTNETTKLARMSEMSIVYGNRFRSSYDNIDQGLNQAEILFYKGNYRRSLEVSIRVIEAVEPNFGKKLDNFYKKEI